MATENIRAIYFAHNDVLTQHSLLFKRKLKYTDGKVEIKMTCCVKTIVKAHGGDIKAYNIAGGGFGIEFRLPLMK